MLKRYRKETKEHIWILVLCAGAIGLSLLFNISEDGYAYFLWLKNYPMPETCFFRVVLNRNCPLCGLTRSFISISHLDFRGAWLFNKAGIFLYAIVISQIPYRAIAILKHVKHKAKLNKQARFIYANLKVWITFLHNKIIEMI